MNITKTIPTFLAATAMVGTLGLTTMQPAKADGAASTRNIILGAAAIAGLAIEANVANKNAVANTVEGYTADGATVYADGHVVLPDGESYYPGNDGQQIACNEGSCSIYAPQDDAYQAYPAPVAYAAPVPAIRVDLFGANRFAVNRNAGDLRVDRTVDVTRTVDVNRAVRNVHQPAPASARPAAPQSERHDDGTTRR